MTSAEYAGDTSLFCWNSKCPATRKRRNFYAYITGTDLFAGITHGGIFTVSVELSNGTFVAAIFSSVLFSFGDEVAKTSVCSELISVLISSADTAKFNVGKSIDKANIIETAFLFILIPLFIYLNNV